MKKLAFIFVYGVLGVWYAKADVSVIHPNEVKTTLEREENTLSILRFFIQRLTNDAIQPDAGMLEENLYYTAECLFRLKAYPQLNIVLNQGRRFAAIQNKISPRLQLVEAKYLIEKGVYGRSMEILDDIAEETKDAWLKAEAQLALGDILRRKEHWPASIALYRQVAATAPDTLLQMRAFNGIGSCYLSGTQFDSAQYYYKAALQIGLPSLGKSHTRVAQVNYNLGLLANREGDYYAAEQRFLEALRIYLQKLGPHHAKTAEVYGALGSVCLLKDDLEKALLYLLKERDILLLLDEETPDLIYSYLNTGKVYYYQKEWAKAEQALQNSVDMALRFFGKSHQLYLQSIVEWARVQVEQQRYGKARVLLEELVQIHREDPDDYLADVYMQLGDIAMATGADAAAYFRQANNLYEAFYGQRNVYSIDALLRISEVHLKNGDVAEAIRFAEQALQRTIRSEQIVYAYDHWECQWQLLRCYEQQYADGVRPIKFLQQDIALIKETLQEAAQIRQTYFSSGSRLYYAEKMTALNEMGIRLLSKYYSQRDQYFMEHVWLFSENNKANLLRYRMDTRQAYQLLPEKVRQQMEQLVSRWNYFMMRNENEEEAEPYIRDSLVWYQSKYETLTKDIYSTYPEVYGRIYQVEPLSLKQVQQGLTKASVYISYFTDGDSYYRIVITPKSYKFSPTGKKKHTDSLVRQWREAIENKTPEKQYGSQLAALLLPESLPQKLIISPDGMLHQLAFDALPVKGRYLIYEHSVSSALSAATYFHAAPPPVTEKIAGFFPDFSRSDYPPLSAEKENKALGQFTGYTRYAGNDATAQQLVLAAKSAKWLHIATHIEIDSISPMHSRLLMQPGTAPLDIGDIKHLQTSAQLVSLAACKGNFGQWQSGEGLLNFAWAFRYAGAHEVLLTQWSASDKATATIMEGFYHYLSKGTSTEEALQKAKLDYIAQTDAVGARPFYWANFQLLADADETRLQSGIPLIKYLTALFLCLIICYLAYVLYQYRIVKPIR